jgi:hypothetical protein
MCVCVFSLRRESPDMILGDKPLLSEVVLSQRSPLPEAPGLAMLICRLKLSGVFDQRLRPCPELRREAGQIDR